MRSTTFKQALHDDFLMVGDDKLFNIMLAANDLEIKSLLDLTVSATPHPINAH
jgi:hypothetical protein